MPGSALLFNPNKGFHHLCLKYNREGDPRIYVVAVDATTKKKIRPSKTSAETPPNGNDKACPIRRARIYTSTSEDYVDFSVGQFLWDDTQWTIIHDPDPGGWTIAPGPDMLGDMELTVQGSLKTEEGQLLQFKS